MVSKVARWVGDRVGNAAAVFLVLQRIQATVTAYHNVGRTPVCRPSCIKIGMLNR